MTTLSRDDLHSVETRNDAEPRRSLKLILHRLAIGQILREEYVYEIHGPFVADEPAPPRPRLAAWMIARLERRKRGNGGTG